MLLDSLRNLSLEPFGFDARVLRNLVHCLGLLPKVVPRVVPMFTCKVTRHQQAQIYLLRRHQVVRTITNKPGLVIPTNPLVVVVQTQHQWTVTLPPLHLQRVSVLLKYQLVLIRWAHNIKLCQRFLENIKTKYGLYSRKKGKDGLRLLCKRWNSTNIPKEKAYIVTDILFVRSFSG